mmetsp:Transcript_8031/g.18147  ORF Transcript_8031/g.18147 Transcript_8031/m.18147 type:complete len:387 (+) Transcript_8031:1479-2639(+)
MGYQLTQNWRKLIPHNLGKVSKCRIRKLVQISGIKRQSLAGTLHRRSKVGTEMLLTHGNGNVSHAFQRSSTQRICLFLLKFHEFRHERCYAHYIRGEFLLSGNGRGCQCRRGHFLHATLVRGLQHGCQLSHKRVKEGTYTLGLQPFAKHFKDVARRRLNGNVGIVQEGKHNGQNLRRVTQHLWLTMLADLTQSKTRAFTHTGIAVPRSLEDVGHDLCQILPQWLGASFGNDTQACNACLALIRIGAPKTCHAPANDRFKDVLFGNFACQHVQCALCHARLGDAIFLVGIVSFLILKVFLPCWIGFEQGSSGTSVGGFNEVEDGFDNSSKKGRVAPEMFGFGFRHGGNDQCSGVTNSHFEVGIGHANLCKLYNGDHVRSDRRARAVG